MTTNNGTNDWDKIQLGVKNTERKIGQKEYNTAMLTAYQTLKFMVKLLAERADIENNGELKDIIDALYQNRWISKTTCEHYHKIRILGDKAMIEGDANPYNANQTYHMLSQEVYTFANDYSNARKGSRRKSAPRTVSKNETTAGSSAQTSTQNTRTYTTSTTSRSRKRTAAKSLFTAYDLMKLLIPVLCIILLFFVGKLFKPNTSEPKATGAEIAAETLKETPAETETNSAEPVYRAASNLNVRKTPSTDGERIGQLIEGSTVDYVKAYDEEWAEILYQGQTAYVASQYLTVR